MTVRTITVTIPEMLFLQLEAAARSSAQSVDAVVAQSLERAIPPHLATLLPAALQAELDAMEQLSDEALWTMAYSTANDDKIALFDLLIERQNTGTLTTEGRRLLTQLRDEVDALMLRKAHAYALLQSRGYTLPSLDDLHAQTP